MAFFGHLLGSSGGVFELAVERGEAEVQLAGGFFLVPLAAVEDSADVLLFEAVEGSSEVVGIVVDGGT